MNVDLFKALMRNKILHIDRNALAVTVRAVRLGYLPMVKRTDTGDIIWIDAARDTYIDAATTAAIALSVIADRCRPPQ